MSQTPPKDENNELEFGIPTKRSRSGRPKKICAFSSFKCYEERDIEFFIHQVSDNQIIWDRRNSLNFDGNLVHATFDKIEICCQFLARKNGENASRLWTELASEYKREKARIEQLPSGIYSEEFEIRFPFMQQMWFLEIEASELKEADSNSLEETIVNFARQKSINDAPSPSSSLSAPIEHLNSSINRLIAVIDKKSEDTTKRQIPAKYSDIVEHLIGFLDKTPRERQMEVKCKIYNFLDTIN
ncbi:MADF domain-containing protein [Caenorhabditis elegans]|nr:MADF domain-containing protein [Caenorhabditis elegans]CDH93234.1 MADF domain-containing protein [Caenorhabditis elegans]|eukprot:NP_001294462.1 MADF domain transcription factor [Caenorhabditis elegans]